MLSRTLAAFVLLCASAIGAPPQLKVTHTPVTVPGDILRITATAPDAKSYTWRVFTDVEDKKPTEEQIAAIKSQAEAAGLIVSKSETVEEKVYQLECDGGKAIDLPSWEGQKWVVFCCVANATGEQTGVTVVVVVPGATPPPVPPVPPTPPVPPVPVPTNDLTSLVLNDLKPIVAAHNSISEKIKYGMVAAAYKQVAQEIQDGKLTTRDALLDRTKSLVMTAMGTSYETLWKGTTRKIELQLPNVIKTPLDPKAHVQPWLDIAKGVELAIGVN